MPLPSPTHTRHLSEGERLSIADGIQHGGSLRKIAETLGRNVTAITREIQRNDMNCTRGIPKDDTLSLTRISS